MFILVDTFRDREVSRHRTKRSRRIAMQRERFQLAEARKHLVASKRVDYWCQLAYHADMYAKCLQTQLAYHADMYAKCLQTARNLRAARLAIVGAL